MGYEKNTSFLVIPKSPKVWKKVLKIGLGSVKGVLHLLSQKAPKLACFVLYHKVINFFWKIIHASCSKLSKELKNSIKIKVGQAVLELLIQKQHFDCFDL